MEGRAGGAVWHNSRDGMRGKRLWWLGEVGLHREVLVRERGGGFGLVGWLRHLLLSAMHDGPYN